MLWTRIASDGSPPKRYTLQVPFQLGPTHALEITDDKMITFGDLNLEVLDNQGFQLLRISSFKSPEEAAAFFNQIRGALLSLIVRKKLSLRSVTNLQEVKIKEPPIDVRGNPNFGDLTEKKGWTHLDGYVDPSPAVVIPEHLRILEFGVGSMNATLSMPVLSFLNHITEELALPGPENVAADERLSLAIDLYALSLWEKSRRSRVVSLATSLEALIKPEQVIEVVSRQIDHLLEFFDSSRDTSAENGQDRRELNRLRSRLAGLREESISENLRKLAAAHAKVIGETIDDARRNMVAAYGVRSKLVHDGFAPEAEIASAADWLGKTVPAVLEKLVSEASKPA